MVCMHCLAVIGLLCNKTYTQRQKKEYHSWRHSSGQTRLTEGHKNRLWSDSARFARRLTRVWTFCHIWAPAENTFVAFCIFKINLLIWIHVYEKGWSTKKLFSSLWAWLSQMTSPLVYRDSLYLKVIFINAVAKRVSKAIIDWLLLWYLMGRLWWLYKDMYCLQRKDRYNVMAILMTKYLKKILFK